MASIRRERYFENFRNRMLKAKEKFKTSFFIIIIPSIGLWLALIVYYFIKALSYLLGAVDLYKYPYLLMGYLFIVSAFAIIGFLFKNKILYTLLTALFVISFGYGAWELFQGNTEIYRAVLLMAGSACGFWCSDIGHRQLKEFALLSKEEGYPDFIDILGEPVPMANTRGVYRRQYDELKKVAEKNYAHAREGYVDIKNYVTTKELGAMDEVNTNFDSSVSGLLDVKEEHKNIFNEINKITADNDCSVYELLDADDKK